MGAKESKYVEFEMSDSQFMNDIMGESGYVVARGMVSKGEVGDDNNLSYLHSIALEWVSYLGKKDILVGSQERDAWDEIFRSIQLSDLMLIRDGTRPDVKNINAIPKPETCENMYRCKCGENWDNKRDSVCDDECPKCGNTTTPYASISLSGTCDTIIIPRHIWEQACDFLEYGVERDTFNNEEDWDSAYEVECSQRDAGSDIAEWIVGNFKEGNK